jgi:hypothetical protein
VGGTKTLHIEFPKGVDRLIHPVPRCGHQVHPADNCMNRFSARQLSDILKSIDDTRVAAAKQHDGTQAGLEEHRLIVREEIRLAAFPISKERAACVFIARATGDFPGNEDSIGHFRRLLRPD